MQYTRINPDEIQSQVARQKAVEAEDRAWRASLDLAGAELLRDNSESKVSQREVDRMSIQLKKAEQLHLVAMVSSQLDEAEITEAKQTWLDSRITQLEAEHAVTVWLLEHPELDDDRNNRKENLLQIEAALTVAKTEYDKLSTNRGEPEPEPEPEPQPSGEPDAPIE